MLATSREDSYSCFNSCVVELKFATELSWTWYVKTSSGFFHQVAIDWRRRRDFAIFVSNSHLQGPDCFAGHLALLTLVEMKSRNPKSLIQIFAALSCQLSVKTKKEKKGFGRFLLLLPVKHEVPGPCWAKVPHVNPALLDTCPLVYRARSYFNAEVKQEAANIHFVGFCLIRSGIEPTLIASIHCVVLWPQTKCWHVIVKLRKLFRFCCVFGKYM